MADSKRARSWKRRTLPRIDLTNAEPVLYSTHPVPFGQCYNHEPHAVSPKVFRYLVDETCEETWAEGLSMFHNPRAVYPVPEELFPSIAAHKFRNKLIVSRTPDFHPFSSVTLNVTSYGQKPRDGFASRVKRHESELAFTDGSILIGGH